MQDKSNANEGFLTFFDRRRLVNNEPLDINTIIPEVWPNPKKWREEIKEAQTKQKKAEEDKASSINMAADDSKADLTTQVHAEPKTSKGGKPRKRRSADEVKHDNLVSLLASFRSRAGVLLKSLHTPFIII